LIRSGFDHVAQALALHYSFASSTLKKVLIKQKTSKMLAAITETACGMLKLVTLQRDREDALIWREG
jgi:hypothetical protein